MAEDLVPTDDGRKPSAEDLAKVNEAVQPDRDDRFWEVIETLAEIADRDCYGDYRGAGEDKSGPCPCETCVAKRAIHKLQAMRLPVVRSLRPDRLNYAERVYFDAWVKQNTRIRGLNGGYGTLELILKHAADKSEGNGYPLPAYVSQRDMDVATTVVQWFGTNVGRCFIDSCEREAKARYEERRDFEHVSHLAEYWNEYREKPVFERVANNIAERYVLSDEARKQLIKDIMRALIFAQKKAEVEAAEAELGT